MEISWNSVKCKFLDSIMALLVWQMWNRNLPFYSELQTDLLLKNKDCTLKNPWQGRLLIAYCEFNCLLPCL